MNYLLLSDFMWYTGHILSGISILFTRDNYYFTVSFVLFGQLITIISRPIGRIQNKTNEPELVSTKDYDLDYVI